MGKSARRIGFDELSFFNRQLASMARLDLPFPEGLRALAKEADGRAFQLLVSDVLDDLEEGVKLSEALSRHPDIFSDLYIGIVESGELSGDLASALEGLANYSESMLFLRQRVRAVLAYPTVALVAAIAMTGFLFLGIMPKFKEVFDSLDIALPGLTKAYLGAAISVNDNGALILTGIVAVVAMLLILRRVRGGTRLFHRIGLNLPFYGKLLRHVLLLRFCETLRALLRSHVSLVPALGLTARTLGDNVLGLTVDDMRIAAEDGRRVSDTLRRNSIFPKTFVWKFALAEEQGTLETTLKELSRYTEGELKTITSRFSSLLEPFLTVLVGLLVGSMVLSVFLPIFELQKQLSGS